MKNNLFKSLIVVIVAIGVIVLGAYAFRDINNRTVSPEETTLAFYSQWVNYEGNPMVDKIYLESNLLTDSFKNKVDGIIASFDEFGAYDPILCAQDVPTQVDVVNTSIQEDSAVVLTEHNYSGGNKMVEVLLVKEDGNWKINDIICQEGELNEGDINNGVSPAIQALVGDYIRENISSLSPEEEVLGGTFYVTSIRFTGPNSALVDYEDGHIALTALASFQVPEANEVEITSFEISEDKEVNFSEIGNIVSTENGWDIVYEEPGKPALREVLIFNRESKCLDETENKSCFPNYWQNGDRVEITGILTASGVEVTTLKIVGESSKVISGEEFDRDNCLAQGGIIMYPDCVGCAPYCSFTEGEEIRETIGDSDRLCVDMCGNGICEEIVCLGEGCPCPESVETCPADCS